MLFAFAYKLARCMTRGCALCRKPIVLVAEEEERFYPFDYERWKNDKLQKTPDPSDAAKGFTWTEGRPAGGVPFGECPQAIKKFIEEAWSSQADKILFFRRRDFEATKPIWKQRDGLQRTRQPSGSS